MIRSSWWPSGRVPRETEVEGNGSVVQLRAIPLVVGAARTGALVLVRDVTELRRRERELLTKDATIREIHHRVKNNLQTVAALLRLQARRIRVPEGRAALEEAVRRVGSIAIVHETLSHTPEDVIDFDDIAGRVAMMAVRGGCARGAGYAPVGRPVRCVARRGGDTAGDDLDRAAAERDAARAWSARRHDRGDGAARAGAAHGRGGGQRRRAARGIRSRPHRQVSVCRSCARSWSRNWAAGSNSCRGLAGGTEVLVDLPMEMPAAPPTSSCCLAWHRPGRGPWLGPDGLTWRSRVRAARGGLPRLLVPRGRSSAIGYIMMYPMAHQEDVPSRAPQTCARA